ncbi:uncharacterized protein LOC106647390 isoform X5 [Copidosoma floridanum]|uniref:uncharacterized protein LOC106647390 isoform X5 n=1 Tax=Copidosoma floridanum TaxID=29053 RepID=UPI0006C946BC|nr:uncharacterized protein LOC106647390 isoform X5 [Copidosoma floridanum]
MVYESDFYTTRRPYSSSSRPYVSSYSVTPLLRVPYYLYDPYVFRYYDFDDEAKDIRAKTAKLLRNIHVFVPRPSISDYDEHTLPERLRSDDYVRRIINAKNARKDIESLPWYSSPQKRSIGEGHLACIKYAGGRPQAKRRSYYTVGDLVPGDVKSDVKLMSYYMKNRKAAEDACGKQYSKPTSWRDRVPELYEDPTRKKIIDEEEEDVWED